MNRYIYFFILFTSFFLNADQLFSQSDSIEANKTSDKKLIVEKEHIVPLNVIKEKLMELGKSATIDSIKEVLDKYLKFATITKEEDKLLNSSGLRQKMPREYYDPKNELYKDLFARYKINGIKIIHSKD